MNFYDQMSSFRENQKSKYENRLMNKEDLESMNRMIKEKKLKEMEEANRLQQRLIEEEIRKEKRQQQQFIDEYVASKINKMEIQFIDDALIDVLVDEAKQSYERKQLILRQDREYKELINADANKFK